MNITRLWENLQDGRVSCDSHGGGYLQSSITYHPQRKKHSTPLGTWAIVPKTDIAADWAECEVCKLRVSA